METNNWAQQCICSRTGAEQASIKRNSAYNKKSNSVSACPVPTHAIERGKGKRKRKLGTATGKMTPLVPNAMKRAKGSWPLVAPVSFSSVAADPPSSCRVDILSLPLLCLRHFQRSLRTHHSPGRRARAVYPTGRSDRTISRLIGSN
jgi:hypothetical protein